MNEYQTIAEIAANIGVSRQAVYLKLKNNDLSNAVKPFTESQGKVTRYSIQGVELIKEAFLNNPVNYEVKQLTDNLSESQATCQNLSSELNSCKAELEKSVKELEQLREKVKSLETANAELLKKSSGLDNLTNKCQELEKSCEVLETTISEMKIQIADLKADKDKLNERLDKADNDRTELIQANKELTIALKAAQALHGMDKQQKVIETESDKTNTQPQPEPQPKQGFFSRLFHKRS